MAYFYGEPLENKGSSTWDLSEFEGRDSVDLLARLIYSEAEGESNEGKRGVAHGDLSLQELESMPPRAASFSKRVVGIPARAQKYAAAIPVGPPPMMAAFLPS